MNTPPKATKYRIRKVVAPAPRTAPDLPFASEDDGFGDMKLDTARTAGATPQPNLSESEIEAIRAEGLTGRQLRMARRVALRHGIDVASDLEAVLILRARGIDPFQRVNVIDLLPADPQEPEPGARPPRNLPVVADPGRRLPTAPPLGTTEDRAATIMAMQRDIVRRRQRNFALLMLRLAVFVFLPTILAGYYFYRLATPLYATQSEFVIQQAEGMSQLGGLLRGTQFATSQDAVTVQSFLQSRDAMLRLDAEQGFKAHFTQGFIDPLQRLAPDATNEAAYKLYKRNVRISFDPTEGIIKMEVVAADPASSQRFAEALVSYAEEQVDKLTQRLREDQMKGSRESYTDAERKVKEAEAKVLALQEKLGVLDPRAESSVAMAQVAELEAALGQKKLQLGQLLDNAKPNQARVEGARGDIARLEGQIAELRASMTGDENGNLSLAQITGELRIAETELQTRQLMLGKALEQQEAARIEANRQVRYLSLGVSPIAPDEPTYPRAFEDTALAFLIFAGIYLVLSLTASILREQVTA